MYPIWGFEHNGNNENLKTYFYWLSAFWTWGHITISFWPFPVIMRAKDDYFILVTQDTHKLHVFTGWHLEGQHNEMPHKDSAILWPLPNNLHYQWLQRVSGKYVRNEVIFWGVFCTHFLMKENLALGPIPSEMWFQWWNYWMFIKF